ncbi:MAG: gliding motility-associated C-terminal domain-containing protein, partial [bacterium]|nr:gliding motility-associated C-terminal domain-containing protein [bacterium]
ADWARLGTAEKGTVRNDLDNWSTWTPPYSTVGQVSADAVVGGQGGARITSPGPRRYFQFKVEYTSEDLFSAKGLGSLSFDYTSPALAARIIAEITPRHAQMGALTDFSLIIVPELRTDVDRGFNFVTIATPVRIESVGRLLLNLPDGSSIEDDFSGVDLANLPVVGTNFTIAAIADDQFQIEIPVIGSSRLGTGEVTALEINFSCVVLRTGTEFVVEAQLQGAGEVAQRAVAGNARILREGGLTAVQNPSSLAVQVERRSSLLINVHADPSVVTPNDDGINDTATIRFDVTDLTSGGDVMVRIYDLSGRLVRIVDDNTYASGRYARVWDGKNERGELASPGLYIYTIDVDADAGAAAKSGTIAVAY